MTRTARTVAAALLTLFACAAAARAADPVEVFIDARDPAFVILQGVAEDAPDLARREMEGYATLNGVSLVPWDAFRANAQALLAPYILRNDYPGQPTILGTVALVKAYPGRPFAVTWNGGLAVSFQDYQYAVESRRAFLDDAEAYERRRASPPADDPIDPARHLAALLGQGF